VINSKKILRIGNKEECKPPAQERLTHTDVELTTCQLNDMFSEHRLVTLERFGEGGSCSESLRGVEAGTPGGYVILGCGQSPR